MARGEIDFQLKLHDCAGFRDPSDALPVAKLALSHGFAPAHGTVPHLQVVEDVETFVRGRRLEWRHPGTWTVAYNVLPEWTGYLISHLHCERHREGITSCSLGALIERPDQAEVEPFAQRLVSLGLDLYPLLSPALGWIDDSDVNETLAADVRKRKLLTISWVNFFGPAYVEKYGRRLLASVPGCKTKDLPGGGVFHQLTPNLLVDGVKEARALRQAVKEHFAAAGVRIVCKAPYVRSEVFGSEIVGKKSQVLPAQNEALTEVRGVLAELLGTTLVLDDGTRVKVLYLDWGALTGPQRGLALAMIQQAAQAELTRNLTAQVRFEFNEVPTDLRRVMDDLVRTQPRLSYAQVEMLGDS